MRVQGKSRGRRVRLAPKQCKEFRLTRTRGTYHVPGATVGDPEPCVVQGDRNVLVVPIAESGHPREVRQRNAEPEDACERRGTCKSERLHRRKSARGEAPRSDFCRHSRRAREWACLSIGRPTSSRVPQVGHAGVRSALVVERAFDQPELVRATHGFRAVRNAKLAIDVRQVDKLRSGEGLAWVAAIRARLSRCAIVSAIVPRSRGPRSSQEA